MQTIRTTILAVTLTVSGLLSAQTESASGIADIDEIRREVMTAPTEKSTLRNRRSALVRWWRFLWHQGYDMSAYNDIWNKVNDGGEHPAAMAAVDQAYAALEAILLKDVRIPEVGGSPTGDTTRTDWPAYHGTDGSQTGYSPDKGPSEGKIAWRVPRETSGN